MADSPEGNLFQHGVASGDPMQDRVIIWTRITTDDDDDREPTVTWWLKDIEPNGRRQTGTIKALADRDWTVAVDVGQLEPGHRYEYGFEAGNDVNGGVDDVS